MKKLHESLSVLKTEDLELFPSIHYPRDWKIGLLYREELEYFRALDGEKDSMLINLAGEDDSDNEIDSGIWLPVDCHFHNLTPVNDPGDPENIVAESVSH